MTDSDADEDLYRIGTVAGLTDISVERLRAWERRYGITPAHRAGRTRFYSREQLEKLSKIKRLIDQGHPISSLAELSEAQLDQRLDSGRTAVAGTLDTGLIGANLLVLEQQRRSGQRDSQLNVLARWANADAFVEEADTIGVGELDLLVVQQPVLLAAQLRQISRQQPEARLLAVYQFATPRQLAAVEELGLPALAWPLTWGDIEAAGRSHAGRPLRAGHSSARRFSDDELVAIAASDDDPSGCPQHLVSLITQLNAFADYSRRCAEESAAEGAYHDPADRYRQVERDAGVARAQLELALEALLDVEPAPRMPN